MSGVVRIGLAGRGARRRSPILGRVIRLVVEFLGKEDEKGGGGSVREVKWW